MSIADTEVEELMCQEDKLDDYLFQNLVLPEFDDFTGNDIKINKDISKEQEMKNKDFEFHQRQKDKVDQTVHQMMNGGVGSAFIESTES